MRKEQRIVAVGAVSGIGLMLIAVFGLYALLPEVPGMTNALERIAYALHMNLFAIIPLFVMIAAVGNARFLGDAIDPTKHAESKAMEIDGRVVENTLQQNVVFFVSTLALATLISPESTKMLQALTTVFIAARLAFWYGYRTHPLYRAPGMAATSYMNLGIILTCLYLLFV